LASLFETNVSEVDKDIQLSKNLQFAFQNEFMASSNGNDQDDFTLETEDGLKMMDTTSTINKKAIFSDFDRLRKWQQQSIDKTEDEEDKTNLLFISKSPDCLFQLPEGNEKSLASNTEDSGNVDINLLLDPFASVVDEHDKFDTPKPDAKDRLKKLEERMSENEFTLPSELCDITSPINEHQPNNFSTTTCVTGDLFSDFSQDISCDDSNSTCQGLANQNKENIEEDFSLLDDLLDDLDPVPVDLPTHPHVIIKEDEKNTENELVENILDIALPSESLNDIEHNLDINVSSESADDLINSPDTREADKIVAIASLIMITPPTPENDSNSVEFHEKKVLSETVPDKSNILDSPVSTQQNILLIQENNENLVTCEVNNDMEDEGENPPPPPPYIEAEREEVVNENDREEEKEIQEKDNTLNLNDNSSNTPLSVTKVTETEKSDNETEIIVESNEIDQIESKKINDSTDLVECDRTDNIESDEDLESPELLLDTTGLMEIEKKDEPESLNTNVCAQASISSVTDSFDDMKCLTPDEDSEETEDIEAYMSSQADSENQNKEEPTISPLPDVNYEINEGQLSAAVSQDSTGLKENKEETSDTTSIVDVQDIEGEKVCKTDQEVEDFGTDVDNIETDTPVVGFTNETGQSDDDLDEMLDNLEADPSLSEIVDPVITVDSTLEPQKNLTEAVLAATSDDVKVTDTKTDSVNSVAENTTTEIDDIAEMSGEAAEQEIETEVSAEGDDSSHTIEGAETSAAGDIEGNTELRTSLRRTGSTSGVSGRRVRFSLEPQFEGEVAAVSEGEVAAVSETVGDSATRPAETTEEGNILSSHIF